MEVKLLHHSPLELVVSGIRKCYDSGNNSDSYYDQKQNWGSFQDMLDSLRANMQPQFVLGEKDKALIKRIIESGHESTIEHLTFTFDVSGVSRALLQEFARHRIGTSLSVKSTRYTLKELKEENEFAWLNRGEANGITYDWERIEKYCVLTGMGDLDEPIANQLDIVRELLIKGYPNDKVKYCLPEAYKTSFQVTFNARSLRHFLQLRTNPRALWEIRSLAYAFFGAIPSDLDFMFEDVVYNEG